MHEFSDEAVAAAGTAAASPHADVLEIRARAADAILGPVPSKKAEAASARTVSPLFERVKGYGPHAALAACLMGVTWMAASYSFGPARTVVQRESVENAETSRTVQKMAEELRSLKANVEAMHAAALENTKPRSGAAKTETSAAIAEVATKIEHLQRESEAKLSEVSERFDRIEHEIAGLLAAAPVAGGSASAAPVARKRAQGGRGDAFDPSQNPTAPGAPHPLGSLAPAASANNAAAETAYGQRTN
jgi:hypothetical protein